ncbi:MAG: hypothetical protein AB8G05_24220 [Oligoflexales bacterium]
MNDEKSVSEINNSETKKGVVETPKDGDLVPSKTSSKNISPDCTCYFKSVEAWSSFAWPLTFLIVFFVLVTRFRTHVEKLFEKIEEASFPGGNVKFRNAAEAVSTGADLETVENEPDHKEENGQLSVPTSPTLSEYFKLLKIRVPALKNFKFIPSPHVDRLLGRGGRRKSPPIVLDGGFSKENEIVFVNVALTRRVLDKKQKDLFNAIKLFRGRFPDFPVYGILVTEINAIESEGTYCVAKMSRKDCSLDLENESLVHSMIISALYAQE